MNSAKISFAFNEKEGLAELRRRQDEAGASSLGKYVKQLVIEHLAHDPNDDLAQVVDSVERLRQVELKSASTLADLSNRIESLATSTSTAEELKALRHSLAMTLLAVLQENQPLTREEAERVVRRMFKGDI